MPSPVLGYGTYGGLGTGYGFTVFLFFFLLRQDQCHGALMHSYCRAIQARGLLLLLVLMTHTDLHRLIFIDIKRLSLSHPSFRGYGVRGTRYGTGNRTGYGLCCCVLVRIFRIILDRQGRWRLNVRCRLWFLNRRHVIQ